MEYRIVFPGVLVALLTLAWIYGVFGTIFTMLLYTAFGLISMYYGAASVLCSGKKYEPPERDTHLHLTDILLQQAVSTFRLLFKFLFKIFKLLKHIGQNYSM